MLAEQLFHSCDRGIGALDQRMAFARVEDRRRDDIGDAHGAVIAQQHHPAVEHAGHAGGEEAGARHHVETKRAVVGNRRPCRRRSLAADHFHRALADVEQDRRHVAARAVEMRLDDLQGEGGRAGGIEGIAAFFERCHADRRCDPMSRGDNPESAFDFRARRERIGIDVAHGTSAAAGGGLR